MRSTPTCPECAAVWQDGETCQDCFYQMLYWEAGNPDYGEVHHLMVLCYYLQHPSLYSPEGLEAGMRLLVDFVEGNLSPQEARRRMQGKVSSRRRRRWKLVATPQTSGAYPYPVRWEYLPKMLSRQAPAVTSRTCRSGCSPRWRRLKHPVTAEQGFGMLRQSKP